MGVVYKLSGEEYIKTIKDKGIYIGKENNIEIAFYHDKIIIKELDIILELDRGDILSVIEEENIIINTILGYKIIILDNVVKNKLSMIEYLKMHSDENRKIDIDTVRIDTLNNISIISINKSTITFNLKKVDSIITEGENLYFINKSILFQRISLPKMIFTTVEDEKKFLSSLKLNKIKFMRFMKSILLNNEKD
ncbi:hypothetical protein [uncultured Clostridium sp.]|jgi:hypothetical protein|uniref:hypothetical protein n=1 Tax=uncultured Clostridium sp. TaxID=59620 RepID=UPI0026385C88|nr:hypothetical protein [uncultured Clostridium sp.]